MSNITISAFACMTAVAVLAACDAPTDPVALPGPDGATASSTRTAAQGDGDPALAWRIEATVATTPAPPPSGCVMYLTSVIEGNATHLGKFTGVGSTCITHAIQGDPDPPFLPAGPPPYLTADFTNPLWTLTAPDGDELWIRSTDAVAVISLTDGSLRAEGTQQIVGGTGRFAGATGEALVGAVNTDGQGPDDFRGAGWIRFRAAGAAGR